VRFKRGDTELVLRRPPLHLRANSNETMRREARVLKAIRYTGVPHPHLVAACEDERVLGACFYVMESITGFNPGNGLPPLHASDSDMRRQMGLNLVDAIARLGALDHLSLGLAGFGKPDNYLERQVARWRAQLESYCEFESWPGPSKLPRIGGITAWLDENHPGSFQPGLLHGDYHLRNVIYDFGSADLLAIVDWELSTIGDPLLDLGWLIATWQDNTNPRRAAPRIEPWDGFPAADELISRYCERSTRDLSAIDWYIVLACFKLGIILEGTYARACEGKAPSEVGERLHLQCIDLLEQAIHRIEKSQHGR
jgi:aminoglycoside phosphotransferase (APT) family kinase protein